MRTVGVLREVPEKKLWEIGVPVGVIAAIVPSTNPTSTVCYKAMIALKSGNAIVFSPHPKAIACTRKAAQIVAEAAQAAGAPADAVACLSIPSLDGCQELMKAEPVRLILATGGPGMVKAAYSSGKPAIGVGAGNGPAYIHRSADVAHALIYSLIHVVLNDSCDLVAFIGDGGVFPEIGKRQGGKHHLGRHPLLGSFRRQTRQLVAGFFLVGLGQHLLDIPECVGFSQQCGF